MQLHVVQVELLGAQFDRVGALAVDEVCVRGVAVAGVVVKGDLAVERQDDPARREHERVHLDEGCVLLDEHLPELHENRDDLVCDRLGELRRRDDLAGLRLVDTVECINRDLGEVVGAGRCDLLDIDAACDAGHGQERAVRAIEEKRYVVLLSDIARLGDEHAVDRVTLDVHAENGLGLGLGVVGRVGELDAAGLATSANLDLRLDDNGRTDLAGRLMRGSSGRAYLARSDRDIVLSEQVLCLVLVQVHA